MPDPVECEGCGKPVDARMARCPHCGHQRRPRSEVRPSSLDGAPPAEPGPAVRLPRFETERAPVPVTGPISALKSALLPAPHTRGWMRWTEVVLTVIALPFFAASALALMVVVKRWGRLDLLTWVMGALFGSFFLWACVGAGLGIEGRHVVKAILVCLAAWALRGVLRALSALKAKGQSQP